LIWMRRACSKR